MDAISHEDPQVKKLLGKVSRYTQLAEMMKLPFWVFVKDSNPIGVVTVGKEPVRLLAPPGTQMAVIGLVDAKRPSKSLERFASEALKLAAENNVEYATITLSSEEAGAIDSFIKVDFQELADTYIMICQLDREIDVSKDVGFVQAGKDEIRKWIELASKFLAGSPDVVMTMMLEHILDLPKNLLNMYYSMEKFYFVNKNQQTIGILNFNQKQGMISNVGVDPAERRKGYGRQIMLFGLKQLKVAGCKKVALRVHIENKPAIHLYESLGFAVKERRKTLIWKKPTDAKGTTRPH